MVQEKECIQLELDSLTNHQDLITMNVHDILAKFLFCLGRSETKFVFNRLGGLQINKKYNFSKNTDLRSYSKHNSVENKFAYIDI